MAQGPSKATVPAWDYMTCTGCEWLQIEKAGLNDAGISHYVYCKKAKKSIEAITGKSLHITPKWCPVTTTN